LSAALHRQPEDHDLRRWLAAALYFNRQHEDAIDHWLKLYDVGQTDVTAWISSSFAALDRFAEALEWHDRTADEDRDELAFRCARALLLARLHHYHEALHDFDRCWDERDIEVGSDDFAHRASRAALLYQMGKHEEFVEARNELQCLRDRWLLCGDEEPRAVVAWVLCARNEIWHPGVASSRAVLLACLDELEPFERRPFYERIANHILASRERRDDTCDISYLRSLCACSDGYPQREVPDWLSGGKRVLAIDTMLDRVFLPGGCLSSDRLTCWLRQSGTRFELVPTGTSDASGHVYASEDADHTPSATPA
jgi:tetratricopeptide (TPR) repeat protein